MQFKPKSEDDIKREGLLPPGDYDFEVVKSEDKISQSNNEMIAVQLKVYGPNGDRVVRDWLMEKIAHKLRHFCASTGLLAKYEAGTLTASDCLGVAGKVRVIIKDDEQYGPQNGVKDYVVTKTSETKNAIAEDIKVLSAAPATKRPAASSDDSIPFARPLIAETWG